MRFIRYQSRISNIAPMNIRMLLSLSCTGSSFAGGSSLLIVSLDWMGTGVFMIVDQTALFYRLLYRCYSTAILPTRFLPLFAFARSNFVIPNCKLTYNLHQASGFHLPLEYATFRHCQTGWREQKEHAGCRAQRLSEFHIASLKKMWIRCWKQEQDARRAKVLYLDLSLPQKCSYSKTIWAKVSRNAAIQKQNE